MLAKVTKGGDVVTSEYSSTIPVGSGYKEQDLTPAVKGAN